jgi:monoamine oxidase
VVLASLGDEWANSPFREAVPDLDDLDQSAKFDPAAAYKHPGDLSAFDGRRRKRVCIIGGGMAGLTAAYELLKLDHDVTLLEGSSRFGGRILTHYFADGTYGELGAMRIPRDHGCVWHYIEEFGLDTREFIGENPQGWCLFRDAPKMRRAEWQVQWPDYYNVTAAVSPESTTRFLAQIASRGEVLTARHWWESLSNELRTPELRQLEASALGQFVRGLPRKFKRALTDEEWEFAGRTTHHLWLARCSMLHWLREGYILDQALKCEIVGGMDLLTQAFVQRIRNRQPGALNLHAAALAVELEQDGALVTWRHPRTLEMSSAHFDYVICTAPAPGTVRIGFRPELPPRKREALTNLSYISAGKTIMRCSKRHWELFDEIYGGTSVTDRPNQQCWYPSDNRETPDEAAAKHLTVLPVLDTTRDLMDVGFELPDVEPTSAERSNSPGVFLAAYVWGTNARRFASLDDSDRDELIRASVAQLHDHNEQYLEDIVHIAWDARSSPGGGAFAFFAPGEQSRYQASLCEPLTVDEHPRVFFAGEHIGIVHGWLQSSAQTALAAVIDVLQAA